MLLGPPEQAPASFAAYDPYRGANSATIPDATPVLRTPSLQYLQAFRIRATKYPDRHTPVRSGTISTAVAVTGGAKFSSALLSDGTVMSWGASNLGQLGNGAKVVNTTPVKTNVVAGAVGIGSGRDHALAFNAAGVAWGWGDNTGGQMGDGGTTSKLTPVVLTGLGHVSRRRRRPRLQRGPRHRLSDRPPVRTLFVLGARHRLDQ